MTRDEIENALQASHELPREALTAGVGLANELAPREPSPANIEALALAAAADGQFEEAARLQHQVMDMTQWMGTSEQTAAREAALEALEAHRLPSLPAWPEVDPRLSPPPANPFAVFRNYPAAVPY